jgi:alpha-galactosidase
LTLYISNAFGLIDGLQAYGNFYHPRTRIEAAGVINGFNTWEYFKKTITSQEITPVLNNLANFATSGRFHRPFIKYFVPDDGWYIDKGQWQFDPTKFPEGAAGWAQKVHAQGMVPGIWIAPTQVSQAIAQQKSYVTLGGSTYQGETVDPSDPVFQQDILGQIRALHDAGFRYFKTDFLKQAYLFFTQGHYFQHSKYPPERVMREFMQGIRQAVGEDSYWLACNAVIASCADLVDAARIGNDIAPDWNTVLAIIPRNSARFWMHDRLWLSDEDFTVIRGTAFMLPGYAQSLQLERNVAGFNNPDEARTWCAYVILTGGPATWSDDPLGTTPAGFDLIRRTMENSGGHQAVPLDLETNRLPSKCVRREPVGIYIGLFNWSDSAAVLQITSAEIPELREGNVATDVLTDAQYPIGTGGWLTLQLNPHQSACLLVPAFGGF